MYGSEDAFEFIEEQFEEEGKDLINTLRKAKRLVERANKTLLGMLIKGYRHAAINSLFS